jgi:hypothetical protein
MIDEEVLYNRIPPPVLVAVLARMILFFIAGDAFFQHCIPAPCAALFSEMMLLIISGDELVQYIPPPALHCTP